MAQIGDKLAVYTLGHTGVVVDQNPLEPSVPDDSLKLGQNAMHDPTMGYSGGVRKRPGLQRFNSLYAGGVILGGIPMPVAGTGGAPATGGGAILGTGDSGFDGGSTGYSGGTGDMTGAPGATFDGAAASTTPAGATSFTGGTTRFSGARLFMVGRDGTDRPASNAGGAGWYVSSKGLADVSLTGIVSPGPPVAVYSYPPITPFDDAYGTPSCIDNIGTTGLYYASSHGNQATGLPIGSAGSPIRRTNGGTDTLVATVPISPFPIANINGSTKQGITSVTMSTPGTGYTVNDTPTFTGGTGSAAQLKVLVTAGGALTGGSPNQLQILSAGNYSVIPTGEITLSGGGSGGKVTATWGYVPQRQAIVAMHYGIDGFIYLCVKDKYSTQDTTGSAGRVFRLSPLDGTLLEWNMTTTPGAPGAWAHLPYCCNYYNGVLFVGTFPDAINESAYLWTTNGTDIVNEGTFSGTQSAYGFISCFAQYNGRLFMGTGAWETTPSFAALFSRRPGATYDATTYAWTGVTTASGGSAANGNYWVSMVEFNGSLYASYFNPGNAAKIYKITANVPGDPTSQSFTISTVNSTSGYPRYLFVDDGVIYAIGTSGGATSALVSTDGTVWTDKSASIPAQGISSIAKPIFFGVNQ